MLEKEKEYKRLLKEFETKGLIVSDYKKLLLLEKELLENKLIKNFEEFLKKE